MLSSSDFICDAICSVKAAKITVSLFPGLAVCKTCGALFDLCFGSIVNGSC